MAAKRTEKIEGNLEVAYAVSIHKAQGGEFALTCVIVPASLGRSLSPELFYTTLTCASRHCTLLIARNISIPLDVR